MGSHLPDIKSGGAYDFQTHYFRLRELDGFLCCHRKNGLSSLRKDRVQDRGPHPATEGGTRQDMAPRYEKFKGGTGGSPVRRPCSGVPPTYKGHQDVGMANCAALHSKRDGFGGSGMERCPLPRIQHRSTRPPSPL